MSSTAIDMAAYRQEASLAERARAYMAEKDIKIQTFSEEVGCSRSLLSQYLSGKYSSDPTNVESKLVAFLDAQAGAGAASPPALTPMATRPAFFESRDAKRILGVCQSCQEYNAVGIITGSSGFGKTHALKHYAKLPRVAYIECDVTMSGRDLLEEIEKALGVPCSYGTNHKRISAIRSFLTVNKGYLLIIDEADKIMSKYTQNKMEMLRAIYDQTVSGEDQHTCGLIIAGEPALEMQIKTYIKRFARRIEFGAELSGLTPQEVERYISDCRVEPDALAELKHRACNNRSGCFRLLDRTLRNTFRILKECGGDAITLDVINQASSMMVL